MSERLPSFVSLVLRVGRPVSQPSNSNCVKLCARSGRKSVFSSSRVMPDPPQTRRVTRSAARSAAVHLAQQQANAELPDLGDIESVPRKKPAKSSRKRKTPEDDKPAKTKKVNKSARGKASAAGKETPKTEAESAADVKPAPKNEDVKPDVKKTSRGNKSAKTSTSPTKKSATATAAGEASPDEIIETSCDVQWGACNDNLIKISTWNICSCRTLLKSGALMDYLHREDPDVLLVQETKMTEASVEKEFTELETHDVFWNHSIAKKGYSGVAAFASKKLLKEKGLSIVSVTPGMGNTEADGEGRVITLLLSNDVAIVNAYVPNAGGKLARLPYRTEVFEPQMRSFLRKLKEKHRRVVYCGDLNVAHHPIDIHESKRNEKSAGHTPQERAEFTNLLNEGWVDVFRHLYPNKRAYTYFSKRFGDRMKQQNKGWRLDYHITNKFEDGEIKDCFIRYDQEGSDHVPTVLLLKHEVNSPVI